jgi:AAA domain, putative AbiEii toxin, Type IV TA system
MDAARLLELENKFILLKRHEQSFEEIANFLPSVNKIILKKWDKAYKDEVNRLKKDSLEGTTILGKDINGKYLYNVSITLNNISELDRIRIDLLSTEIKDIKFEAIKQTHLKVFNQYFKSVNCEFDYDADKNESKLRSKYVLTNNDPLIKQQADAALSFYAKYFLTMQAWLTKKILIKEESGIHFKHFENVLPYGIKQLKVKNFQDIKTISIENLNIDAKWIFLTGENSFGKTTILQAIALSLTGERGATFEKENFAIEYQALNEGIILNYWDKRNFQPFKHLACYGASRLELQHDRSNNEIGEKSSLLYSLFHSDGVLLNIEIELYLWFIENDVRFEETVAIFKKLIPSIDDIVAERKDRKIYYIEKLSSNKLINKQLGSGYKSLIAMIGDMMIRLFKTQPDITKPSDLAGIVLIDELDLHWHPKWQRRLPTLLSEIFPKVQFIASTHSEMPLLGAPEHSIFLKVTRNLEEGIKVHKLEIDLSNLLPNHLLTSALFDMDFEEITSVTNKNKNKNNLRTEDSMQEIEERDAIKAHLKNYEANRAKFSDDLFD